MKTFRAICLDDYTVVDGDKVLELKRGKEYDVSEEKDGKRFVFSYFWGWHPAEWFGGIKPSGAP